MMKRIILLVFTLFISVQSISQNDEAYVDTLVDDFTSKLESRGINTWFYNKRYCLGSIEMFKMDDGSMCTSKGTYYAVYLIWNEDDGTMIKKFDNCGMYYSLTLEDSGLMDAVIANKDALQNEAVLKYDSANWTGKPEQRTKVQPCHTAFRFNMDSVLFSKEYNLYHMTTDAKDPNKNYEHNTSLKIRSLELKMDEVIAQMEAKFRRQ
ncbi:hypothetical protein [Constantimarinum furrinae]|uniref:DUF4468 domain-containing protein n=1 Tax=Constantimarinum furrinae TaxID=2562285 RepID=A0A7G8PW91_9FLAO|nr:hypothetical protein [Constantimarinum furrinae]QNJ98607.1 hypothetical protein ALE3EI_2060 [Constantimarinum furrinae]